MEAILVAGARDFEITPAIFIYPRERRAWFRDRQRHGDGLRFGPRQIFEILLREARKYALQLARESRQRIPRSVRGEVRRAGIQHGHALEVFALRAQQLCFAREELLVEHREMDVLFDALQAAHARPVVVDLAAQNAPELLSVRAAREFLRGGEGVAVAGSVTRDGNGRVCADVPSIRTAFGCDQRRKIETPADGGNVAQIARDPVGAGSLCGKGVEITGFGSARTGSFLHAVLQALADDGPIAEILGRAPDETQSSRTD